MSFVRKLNKNGGGPFLHPKATNGEYSGQNPLIMPMSQNPQNLIFALFSRRFRGRKIGQSGTLHAKIDNNMNYGL